tara:strand:- start:502 stop:867 length:366 start_codon:yes stop_codon:yes gene_type:complete
MNWKNVIRKSPFDTGQMQREALKENKKALLQDFPKFLEEHLDEKLEEAIRSNPKSDKVELQMTVGLRKKILDLLETKTKKSEIEEIMQDEYNVDDVIIVITDKKARIIFEGLGVAYMPPKP